MKNIFYSVQWSKKLTKSERKYAERLFLKFEFFNMKIAITHENLNQEKLTKHIIWKPEY